MVIKEWWKSIKYHQKVDRTETKDDLTLSQLSHYRNTKITFLK